MTTLLPHQIAKPSWSNRLRLNTYRQTLQWVWQIARTTAPRLLVGFLLATLLESLLPAALVLTGRGLMNALVSSLPGGGGDHTALLPWLVLGATLAISQTLISNLGDYWQQGLQSELALRVGLDVLTQAAWLDLAFLESSEAQNQVERARRHGSSMVAQVFMKGVTIANQSVRLGSLVAILLWIEPLVVGWLCLLALPYWWFWWRLAERTYAMRHRRSRKQRQTNYSTNLLTLPQGLPEVKFWGLAPLFIDRFCTLSREFLTDDRQLRRLSLLGNTIFATVGALVLYTLFRRIASRVLAGALTVGDVAIYTGSVLQLQGTVQSLVQTLAALNEQLLHLVDLQAFLALQPATLAVSGQEDAAPREFSEHGISTLRPTGAWETRNHPITQSPCHLATLSSCQGKTGMIEFVNVSFTYPTNEQPALADLSFCLSPGETVALVGENGAGKSTLAILLDEVEALARLAQADTVIKSLPQGYDTVLGWQFTRRNLSLGQWQKLALARGIARPQARLLILDEPSASLDARAEYELFSRFRQAASGRTTLLISHRFSTISMADRILVLEKGRLIETGRHAELLAQGGHYAMLYRLHQQQYGTFSAVVAMGAA